MTRVGKRVVNSIDPNNFGPRVGLAWSPLSSGRLAIRAGYGIYYSRPSFSYLALGYFAPPFFLDSDTSGQPFSNPFATAPPEDSFPLIQRGSSVAATVIDRNARTPYTQQFNTSVQYELLRNTTLQIAYAGSHGVNLFRSVAVNQAQIASLNHPITNAVTGQVITDNSIENASLRAPYAGSEFCILPVERVECAIHLSFPPDKPEPAFFRRAAILRLLHILQVHRQCFEPGRGRKFRRLNRSQRRT